MQDNNISWNVMTHDDEEFIWFWNLCGCNRVLNWMVVKFQCSALCSAAVRCITSNRWDWFMNIINIWVFSISDYTRNKIMAHLLTIRGFCKSFFVVSGRKINSKRNLSFGKFLLISQRWMSKSYFINYKMKVATFSRVLKRIAKFYFRCIIFIKRFKCLQVSI